MKNIKDTSDAHGRRWMHSLFEVWRDDAPVKKEPKKRGCFLALDTLLLSRLHRMCYKKVKTTTFSTPSTPPRLVPKGLMDPMGCQGEACNPSTVKYQPFLSARAHHHRHHQIAQTLRILQ